MIARLRRRSPHRRLGERGFALLIVLWTLVLLALVATTVAAAGRGEARLAANLRSNAGLEAAADGAVFEGLFRALDRSNRHWDADGLPRLLRVGRFVVEVRMEDQSGKVPLNTAPLPLLQALLRAIGVPDGPALTVAAAIADWRSPAVWPLPQGAKAPQYRAAQRSWAPPNAPYRSVDELALVLGMTPEIFERLRQHVTVYTEAIPRIGVPDRVVSQAVADVTAAGQTALSFDEAPTVMLTATAAAPDGSRFIRRAVIRLTAGDQFATSRVAYQILSWQAVPG